MKYIPICINEESLLLLLKFELTIHWSIIVIPAEIPVKLAPLTAGNVAPVIVPEARSDASKLVKLAPLIAGSAPDNLDAVNVDILASATVPLNYQQEYLLKMHQNH